MTRIGKNERVPDWAFVQRYFPDVWQKGANLAGAKLWLLFDRDGNVVDTGRAGADEPLARHPGIVISEGRTTQVRTEDDVAAEVTFRWLGADSPAIDSVRTGSTGAAPR